MNNWVTFLYSAAQLGWLIHKCSILSLWKLVVLLKLVAAAGSVNFLHYFSLYKIPLQMRPIRNLMMLLLNGTKLLQIANGNKLNNLRWTMVGADLCSESPSPISNSRTDTLFLCCWMHWLLMSESLWELSLARGDIFPKFTNFSQGQLASSDWLMLGIKAQSYCLNSGYS